VAAGGIAGFAIAGVAGLAAGGIAGVLAGTWRRRRGIARARERLDEQLADATLAIGAGMRAGLSLTQALSYAAGEVEPPLEGALAHLVDAVGLGTPLEDALTGFAGRIDTDDARLAVGALRLHRRSGGDLPMVLDQVGAALRERRSAAREVRALTAQARLSGAILGLLPIGFFAFLSVTSRRDIAAAYHTRAGFAAIVLGLVLEGAAFLWIRRLLEVQ
jgi:tight adherence protein B